MKSQVAKKSLTEQGNIIDSDTKQVFVNTLYYLFSIVVISVLVNLSLRIDILYFSQGLGEYSFTEFVQIILLLSLGALFCYLSIKINEVQHAAILVAGFFSALAIREMDFWLDTISHGFWLYPALLVSLAAIYQSLRGGRNTFKEMAVLMSNSYFKQMMACVILLLVFSRLYGMGDFWREAMGENYTREVKNISEEGIELLCYSLITCSAYQAVRSFLRKKYI
ncbi:hypothetical protein [Vibrio panuliri]|uniref:Uncharacterized protein n=1 Tax=Vibrio panuliri TaxID=1381081 RepID=A0ABX3FCU9_9VIBR|nr:hypothetical protein [Vibrio panuliri]KAB1457663.1 hypothetical protein F7O85_07960 [Vibrio panuliri]OLQ87484.1 hypothetical protein BIY20_13585 [Vibrio panuliri]